MPHDPHRPSGDIAVLEPPGTEKAEADPVPDPIASGGSIPLAWPPSPGSSPGAPEPAAAGQEAVLPAAEPLEPASGGIVPSDLVDIFIRPSRFFSSKIAAGSTPYLVLVAWCYGIAEAMDRIDRVSLQSEMGRPRAGWGALGPLVMESWAGYWTFCLVMGAASGAFLYMVGGWWYRVRLKWAGDPSPDPTLARRVYVYSSFVMAAPMILAALGQTMTFPHYAAAWQSAEIYTLALIIFPFWSIAASYAGARAVFRLGAWRARIWFLILPVMVYLVAFGAIALAAALLGA